VSRVDVDTQNSKGSFKQHTNGVTRELGIRPLVRLITVLRSMKYGDVYDRNDEHFQIAQSTVRQSCTEFWELMIEIFGPEYLNRCPTAEEKSQLHGINSNRGFPGHLASWDCKHFDWQLCPRRLAGQAKGKEDCQTLILETITDVDTYIWYVFWGEPGSLNGLDILDKSYIVASILNGSLDLEIPDYESNGTIRNWIYFLNDGIYPSWAIFVKTIPRPGNDVEKHFSTKQEHSRKEVEWGYGWRVLVKRFGILKKPICIWYQHNIAKLLKCCVIMHNMIVESC
jgi:hypothetical protein